MQFNEKNFNKLLKTVKRLHKERDRYRNALLETMTLFDFDKGAYLSTEAMQKLAPNFYVKKALDMNVVRSKN